jgi:hypothetical protein
MCAILQDMSAESGPASRYIEYCMNRWMAQSNDWGDDIACASIQRVDGRWAYVPLVVANLTATSPYVVNFQTPTIANAGQIGANNIFQGTITAPKLTNAVSAINSTCGSGHSATPANYRIVGLEAGMERWRHMDRLSGSQVLLQAWTASN